eukprot:TRINITY_DN8729_c3_g1_i1.p4 TRINITY_DN8729_c3_g1~~TRINITY_DN8729_c3_g1_i1.p4  ORF type:complete len:100 (-),score=2.03 TRINITY_DN8729_c3_g1_i1:637-936(-)
MESRTFLRTGSSAFSGSDLEGFDECVYKGINVHSDPSLFSGKAGGKLTPKLCRSAGNGLCVSVRRVQGSSAMGGPVHFDTPMNSRMPRSRSDGTEVKVI